MCDNLLFSVRPPGGLRRYLPTLLLVFASGLLGCGPIEKQPAAQPNLVVIGEDLSETFDKFTAITEDDLRKVCEAVAHTRAGGKVFFLGIGSTTPKGYASCTLRPLKKVAAGAAIPKKIAANKTNAGINQRNSDEIERFLREAAAIIERRKQPYTDINGFFDKVSVIVNDPGYVSHRKWLFVNTDGRQSTKTTNRVDCTLLPPVDFFCVSNGWKKKPDCEPTGRFLGPDQFIQYFNTMSRQQLTAATNE